MHATTETERWSGYSLEFYILALAKINVQVCIFAREDFVFSLMRSFSVALLSLSHDFLGFENSSKIQHG